jgi:hypothetical protein
MSERNQIRDKALNEYLTYQPDILATACPLCKKTFAKSRELPVMDIAEIVYMSIKEKAESGSAKTGTHVSRKITLKV